MDIKRINYKSDFDFILSVVDSTGADVGFPTYDWEARLRTCNSNVLSARSFIVSCMGGVCSNCFNDNGRIHVVADSHGLGTGMMHVEFHAHLPNDIYPDGAQLTVSPQSISIELVTDMGDTASDLEVQVQVPYIWQSAYDMAVSQGYGGTMAEYIAAAAQLPTAVETATAVHDSVEELKGCADALTDVTQSVDASAKTLEMLLEDYREGKFALAEAMTGKIAQTSAQESLQAMAQKIEGYVTPYKMCDGMTFREYAGTTIPENIDTSNVTNMNCMFIRCSSLTTIPQLDTSNVTNMYGMFYNCSSLTTIPQLDTSNVTNMSDMFTYCSALTTIPQLDTSNVTNMYGMFYNCSSLTTIPQLDTSNVTNMYGMFYGCKALTTVRQIDMSKATNISRIFYMCGALVFALIKNIGKSTLKTLDFSSATAWGTGSDENRQSLIDSLVTYSHDRAAAGMATATIKLSTATKALLTSEEIAQITAKGFTIA